MESAAAMTSVNSKSEPIELVAYAAGTRANSYRFYRELVRTWTAKRTSARRKLSALELHHSPGGRVVCGSFDLAGIETPRDLDFDRCFPSFLRRGMPWTQHDREQADQENKSEHQTFR
jgi:hypothetical protein